MPSLRVVMFFDLLTYELSKDYNEEFARFKKIRNNM